MLARAAQLAFVLLAAAVAWFITARWAPPGPAAIVIGLIAAPLCLAILIRPISVDSWESFWEGLSGWMWWW